MKKFLSAALVLILCAGIFANVLPGACFAEEHLSGFPNPLHESDRQGVLEATGFALDAPENAQDVEYFYLDTDPLTAELRFTLDGHKFAYRASGENAFKDISGMYYTWENTTEAALSYLRAELSWNEGKEGIMLWYDLVPGVMYSLSVDSGADPMLLCSTADDIFVPVQGDAYGEGVLPVEGPVYCTVAYIDGADIGLRALNGDEIYELGMNEETFLLTEVAVGDVVRVLYRGDLAGGATAVQIVRLSVVDPEDDTEQ